MVGMSKNGSRYGRRSNWFKIHCLLQEQQQQREQQQQHHQSQQPHDLMFLGLMDEYKNNNRSSLSSSSPSISSPDSHNSDSSVDIGDKKKISNGNVLKVPPKIPTSQAPGLSGPPLTSQLASFFQLMPSPLGPLPLHLVGSPFGKLMPPPPPLASSAPSFLPPSLFGSPFHDYHHLYAQQQSFLSPATLSPLANLPNSNNINNNNNNNSKDSINNNLLIKSKTSDFYKKYYFNKIKRMSDNEDEIDNEHLTPSHSPVTPKVIDSPIHSSPSHSPIICDEPIQNNPIDLSMKNDDVLNNNN